MGQICKRNRGMVEEIEKRGKNGRDSDKGRAPVRKAGQPKLSHRKVSPGPGCQAGLQKDLREGVKAVYGLDKQSKHCLGGLKEESV